MGHLFTEVFFHICFRHYVILPQACHVRRIQAFSGHLPIGIQREGIQRNVIGRYHISREDPGKLFPVNGKMRPIPDALSFCLIPEEIRRNIRPVFLLEAFGHHVAKACDPLHPSLYLTRFNPVSVNLNHVVDSANDIISSVFLSSNHVVGMKQNLLGMILHRSECLLRLFRKI